MGADEISPLPAQRIDMIVTDPASGEQRRRTDYAGTVWFGGRPQMTGTIVVTRGGIAQITAPFWLPDSHAYEPGAAGDVQIQASAAVQGAMATNAGGTVIDEVGAALGEDPQNNGALLVYVTVSAVAKLPLGVAYRVTVICAPEAMRTSAA
jgi:hypothetical protein